MNTTNNEWVTILYVSYIHEVAPISSLLEGHDIEVNVLDELTVQTLPFYSNAIGGIRIQVRASKLTGAKDLLSFHGYIKEENPYNPAVLRWLDNLGGKIPILNQLSSIKRIISVVTLFLLLISIPTYFALRPSLSDKLTKRLWCITSIKYDGVELEMLYPSTRMRLNSCQETMFFDEKGEVTFPEYIGMETPIEWKEDDDGIVLYCYDSSKGALSLDFEGFYFLEFVRDRIYLTSDLIEIEGYFIGNFF